MKTEVMIAVTSLAIAGWASAQTNVTERISLLPADVQEQVASVANVMEDQAAREKAISESLEVRAVDTKIAEASAAISGLQDALARKTAAAGDRGRLVKLQEEVRLLQYERRVAAERIEAGDVGEKGGQK
jgi:hypothetical protein